MKLIKSQVSKIVLFHLIGIFFLITPLAVSGAGKAGTGKADAGIILGAMQEELARSMKVLGEKGNPAPYFISYRVTDTHSVRISAEYGALGDSSNNRSRYLDVDLRVGSHKLDNTHRIRGSRGDYSFSSSGGTSMTLEDDPDAIKSIIWRETDKMYKKAAEKLIKVKSNQGVNVEEEDKSDDFSKEKKAGYQGDYKTISPDIPGWEAKIKSYSALFNKYGELQSSSVSLSAIAENKYFVSSGGSKITQGRIHWRLRISASTKADDGMNIQRSQLFDAVTADKLPTKEEIEKEIEKLAKEVIALRKAPLMEPYTGPAILSGRAAGVFFHEIFGHRIEGHNLKDESKSQTFAKQVGKPVLPDFISVYDDPNLKTEGKQDLLGYYMYDDEGVRSQRVNVVEKGILKNFLMSRSPIKNFPNSNGHGRASVGRRPVSRQGNLVVEASKTYSQDQLKELLRKECKKQGKPFGLFFVNVTGGFTHTSRFRPQAFNVTPVTVYRVYMDGRPDELVRGVNLVGTPLTSFSKIMACSDKREVFNGYCGSTSGRVPVSAVAPYILTAQIEVEKKAKSTDKPPVLPAPGKTKKTIDAKAAGGDMVLKAMKDEMARSMKGLKIENMEKPYFIEYTIFDTKTIAISGTFGALVRSYERKNRMLKIGLRVGDYDMDNTGFATQRGFYRGMIGKSRYMVVENDYNALRHDIWLATDDAYKDALENLAAKKAYLKNQAQTEPVPDFSREKKVEKILPLATIKVDKDKWKPVVKRLSALFKKYPAIHHSGVKMSVNVTNRYYVNSEGTAYRRPETLVTLSVYGTGRAKDGLKLKHHVPFIADSPGQLPPEKEMTAKVDKMAEELTAMINAPVLDNYMGPVIFTGQASAELFTQLLAPNLSGDRPPLSSSSRVSMFFFGTKLGGKLNRRILPKFLSISDDPTLKTFKNTPLMGGYPIDAEGVVPTPVKLVEKGKLNTLLMSRKPRKEILNSNGHARSGSTFNPGANIGNMLVSCHKPGTFKALKEELIEFCKDQGLEYGLMVKTIDNPGITGRDASAGGIFARLSRGAVLELNSPALVYKISAKDGKEELVRGLDVGDLDHGDFKNIRAAGDDYFVYHKLITGSSYSIFGSALGSRGAGFPASIVAPSVLFEEVEFKKRKGKKSKPPLMKHPYFVK